MNKYTDYTAYVTVPNTPETDMMERVMHTVEYKVDGIPTSTYIHASDPMTAISIIRLRHNGLTVTFHG